MLAFDEEIAKNVCVLYERPMLVIKCVDCIDNAVQTAWVMSKPFVEGQSTRVNRRPPK